MRDPRFDILFEPVQIGPVVAKNRFYQPPHCNGMGSWRPQAHAAMRGVKAEGGWAVVNSEHCSIHPTSDVVPEVLHALWDDADIPNLALWWGDAARRARKAGFDIVNVDANFSTVAFQFLSPRNTRTDEYGGSLENRVRLLRELIEVTREAVEGTCAVSVRVIIDEMCGPLG